MAKKIDCPVAGCTRRASSIEALNAHLYSDHLKQDIIVTLLVMMDLAKDLQTKLRDLNWRNRADV